MYRHQQYESRLVENVHHEEMPFFREAVALIDNCTKLPRDDRIFLRNRIKEYLRILKQNKLSENEEESDQMKQIIQIFIEANKKKSLSKIQKGDKAMDWLQIKLRKFVDNAKKEKHRREVQNFRKGKFIDVRKLLQPTQDKNISYLDSKNTSHLDNNHFSAYEKPNYHLKSAQNKHIFAHSSLSRSREKEPIESSRKKSQNNSYSQYSYHQTFGFLKKSKDKVQVPTRDTKPFMQPTRSGYNSKSKEVSQQKAFKLNKSLQSTKNWSENAAFGKLINNKPNVVTNNYLLKQTGKNIPNIQVKPTIQKNSNIEKTEIDRLTKLFSQHLNASSEKISQNNSRVVEAQKSITDYSNMQNSKQLQLESLIPLSSNRNNEPSNSQFSRYEESSKKLQEMLDTSKHLFEQFSFNNSLQLKAPPQQQRQLSKKPSEDDLFTPPQFLAECRKFISNSSKKKESQPDPFTFETNQGEYGKKLTFSNVLRESREKMEQRVTQLNQMSINEAISENVSANISTKKPESEVAFRFKNISINNAEDLLLQLFKKDHKIILDRYQLGEVMSKCSAEIEKLLQKYCDVLSEQLGNAPILFELQFVSIVKYFFSYKKILKEEEEQYSNFLCSILDMKQLGYISRQNIDEFVESMQGSEVDPLLLENIRKHLYSIYERCCAIEGGSMLVTRWSLFYLQLTGDVQFNALKQQLSNFDFQIDMQDGEQDNEV